MKTTDFNNEQNIKTKSEITKTLFAIRVSDASGFNLCVIASPVNSSQFRTISHNSRTVERNSAQFRAIACNGIPIGNPICKGMYRSFWEEYKS